MRQCSTKSMKQNKAENFSLINLVKIYRFSILVVEVENLLLNVIVVGDVVELLFDVDEFLRRHFHTFQNKVTLL